MKVRFRGYKLSRTPKKLAKSQKFLTAKLFTFYAPSNPKLIHHLPINQIAAKMTIHASFMKNTFISNERLNIVKLLAKFKLNAEAQFPVFNYKQQYSTLKTTPLIETDKS